jgi:cell wall-associated NlpC family hydrolase
MSSLTPSHKLRPVRAALMAAAVGVSGAAFALPSSAHAATLGASFSVVTRWRPDVVARQAADALVVLQRDGSASPGFLAARHDIAVAVAARTALAPEQFETAWTAAGDQRTTVVLAALSQLGVPYRHNMSAPGVGFDCSGLTMYAWGTVGVDLPHQSERQIAASTARDYPTALAGDLIQYPGHVMLYLGVDRAMIHAPNTGHRVEVRVLPVSRRVHLGSPLP